MREIVLNGEPKLYHSNYAYPSLDDINDFLIDVTCQAYQETGTTLEVIDKGGYTSTLHVSVSYGRVVSFYMSATQPFVEGLLSSLKEAPGRLDAERLKHASVLAAESVVSYYGYGGEESFQWFSILP